MKKLLAALVLAGVVAPMWAATRTVTLAIPSAHCAMCHVTVKEALSKVPGVRKIEVSLAKKDAVVTFDDAKTPVGALTAATRNAGYPSAVER
ncbi:MAG: mercury resistance system periplasmic binding protein MerP [Pseudomonadota bacterium]|jgi:mercuric ion binding protein|nr:mercury resistance system periplasmic binding protein MerP [Pseudomonadota bacterium]